MKLKNLRPAKKGLRNGLYDLLAKVLYYAPNTNVPVYYGDHMEGCLVAGQTGSGKSSGVAKHIALSMLVEGFSFCVLCAKPGERRVWEEYAYRTRREKDLIVFSEDSPYSFNVIDYELNREGKGSGERESVVNTLMSLVEQVRIHRVGGNGKDEKFWDDALRVNIKRNVALHQLAGEPVTIASLRKVVVDSFDEHDLKRYNDIHRGLTDPNVDQRDKEKIFDELQQWIRNNHFLYLFTKANGREDLSNEELEDMQLVGDYWLNEWPRLAEKTVSIIKATFTALVEPFLDGVLRKKFATETSHEIIPERVLKEGKILVVDFNVKDYGLAGILASTIYKNAYQRAAERRDVEMETNPIPSCLFIDEYSYFCSPLSDSLFQSTARSSLVATLYVVQNINLIEFCMGEHMPHSRARSLLGNLNLKYFCCNDNADTNHWASSLCGQHLIDVESRSIEGNRQGSRSYSQQFQDRITPDHYSTLKTGGNINNGIVEAVAFKAGKKWDSEGNNFTVLEFDQNI